ncbi:hypothetical protein PYW08_014305 [Mythimna loreyi]|uniref:Uncharacterized protein n=1 Tax=Mythimna loreyi TaxID=667449 RepID=A0ACC2R7P0_9NEOP|nr:hypothetical protein PYW08_014305 [Mythimna loreyi]
MDSNKVVFLLTLFSILYCHAEPQKFKRAMIRNKNPSIFNKHIYNIPSILKDIRDNPNRRNLVSEEEDGEPDIYVVRRRSYDEDVEKFNRAKIRNPSIFRRNFVSAEDSEPNVYVVRKSAHDQDHHKNDYKMHRRMYDFHPGMRSPILSAPTSPNHLPEAEPILPGHTLLRPALGMLKSQVKFPHKEMDDGAGVYGNLNNLGISYSGTGERVLYTGFRRSNNNNLENEAVRNNKPRFLIALIGATRNNEFPEKPIARYIDYGKLERERKQKREEEKKRALMPPDPYNIFETENKVKDVKRLLTSLSANGVTLEFFEIPRLKVEAMQDENKHESILPYAEFLQMNSYLRMSPSENYGLFGASRLESPAGIKKYVRR